MYRGINYTFAFDIFSCIEFSIFDVVMSQIKAMAEDIQPLLAEVRDGGLLTEVESLTKSLTQASEDLRWSISTFSSVIHEGLVWFFLFVFVLLIFFN